MGNELTEEFHYPTMFGEADVFMLETDNEEAGENGLGCEDGSEGDVEGGCEARSEGDVEGGCEDGSEGGVEGDVEGGCEDGSEDGCEASGENGSEADGAETADERGGSEATGEFGDPIRVLYVGGGFQSATYLGDKRFMPVFEYHRAFDHMFEAPFAIHRVAMIGGGAFSYPKHLLTSKSDTGIDVVEIDAAIVEIARKHFFVDELEARFGENGTERPGRLRTIIADGVDFLAHAPACAYEAIINDSFDGTNPTGLLMTPQCIKDAKRRLVPGGLYMLNAVTDDACEEETAQDSNVVDAAMQTLSKHFSFVYEIPCIDFEFSGADNYLIVATDTPCEFTNVRSVLCS